MNKEEAKQKLHNLAFAKLDTKPDDLKLADVMQIVNQIDEPQAGHAEEAPRYVRNVIARLRELPLHDREVWLKAIMDEFEEDFCHSIWREGYEQGKFEGAWVGEQLKDADKIRRELNKPVVPQFVADWIEKSKTVAAGTLKGAYINAPERVRLWWKGDNVVNVQIFARAWLDGYEVEEEKWYLVKIKSTGQCLGKYYINNEILSPRFIYTGRNADGFTLKELEQAGFGWVFDCEGVEVKEVEE